MKTFEKLAAAAWAAVAGFSALDAAGAIPPGFLESAPLCLFHALTGFACPGCGMTRALVAAFKGQWTLSAHHHSLGLPLIGVWTAWLAWGASNRLRRRPFSQGFPDLARGGRGWALVALVLAVYAARLA
jgi:hypothetical protein